jgi:DOPA 4,5-dioxygenase
LYALCANDWVPGVARRQNIPVRSTEQKKTMPLHHAHIYYALEERSTAEQVRADLAAALPQLTYVGGLIDRPIGPHPLPMLEVHLPPDGIEDSVRQIDSLRRELTVLIHPMTTDQLADHTESARWLGEPLPLDLSVLKK